MKKAKSNRFAAKRYKPTKRGGFKRRHAYTGHLRTAKTAKRRRNLRKGDMVSAEDARAIKRLLPYS